MKIKVCAGLSGVISTGSYQNYRPQVSAELEYDFQSESMEDILAEIGRVQKMVGEVCEQRFKETEQKAIAERIQRERQDIKLYPRNGQQYPSVTSIIGFDADMFCSPEELAQYASQSNIVHAQSAHFIKTKEWKAPKDLAECWTDIVICTKGSLKLDIESGNFPAFLEKHPITDMVNGETVFNDEYKYAGTPDFYGTFNGKKTIFDIKRTADPVKNFQQMAAYAKCVKGIEQMVIVPLNNKTKQGFSQPIVETRIDEYFGMFLKKREAFRGRFGI